MMNVEFENLPNFRQAGGSVSLKTADGLTVKDGMIYRSSRTDFITEKDVALFRQLGIKSIIDLRGTREYKTANGTKLLNALYSPFTVKNGVTKELKPSLPWGDSGALAYVNEEDAVGHRYLVSMTSIKLIWFFFSQMNFLRWFTLLVALFDWFTGTNYFVKLHNYWVLNEQSLSGRYVEILEYAKEAVRDCVRIINNKENLPTLIHCAHGKDRTGIIVAVVLSAIGVEDEPIMKDFGMSEVS